MYSTHRKTLQSRISIASPLFSVCTIFTLALLIDAAVAQDDKPPIPRDHWSIQLDTKSEKNYLEQIDALGIELGLVHRREAKLHYASKISKKTVFRNDVRKNEERFYLTALTKKEKDWEAGVFSKKGIETDHSITVRFLPKPLIKKMIESEDAACKRLGLTPGVDVGRTQFGMKKSNSGWEIVLLSVEHRINRKRIEKK